MLTWLSQNIGTIIVLLIVVLIVAAIVKSMRRDKKNGKSSCGGNCALYARTEVKTARPPLTINMEAAPIGVLCSVLPPPPERRAQLGNRLCPFCVL